MALHPRQQRFEAILLRSPEKPLPIFGVVSMLLDTMFNQITDVRKALAADPTHHRGRSNSNGKLVSFGRLCSTSSQTHVICRHAVGCQLHILAAEFLRYVPLTFRASEILQQPNERPKGHEWALALWTTKQAIIQSARREGMRRQRRDRNCLFIQSPAKVPHDAREDLGNVV